MAALSCATLQSHGKPGGFGAGVVEMVAMLTVKGDDLAGLLAEMMNGGTFPHFEDDLLICFPHFDFRARFSREKSPPVGCNNRQAA